MRQKWGAKSVLTGSGYVKPYLKKSRAFRRYGKKNVKTLDRPWADNPHKEKYPFQKLADRPHGNRSRKYFPARHAAPVNLTP
ncbi:hypothetical protein [Sphingobacterium daejeonense]|uniref:hypothetical protein n=1 Tax=Sphingobacterium daejeonense TaxID=371142 RepID=UPI0010FEC0D2|nr:hypothetical protein [Sphingobacterium daejeonense]